MASSAPLSRITVLSGGVGGARFIQGLLHGLRSGLVPGGSAETEVTVVANTADDWWIHGLKVCPDLDTVMYTLGDGIDVDRGWGRREETWSAKTELEKYGVEPTWFGLGDRDIATHLVRTQMLEAGFPLSKVTEALCRRWLSTVHGGRVRLLPMSDDRVETHIAIADADSPSGRSVIHFQEYWVRLRAEVPGRGGPRRRPGDLHPGAGCPRGDRHGRPGGPAAVQPRRLRRHHPRRARHPRRGPAPPTHRSSASPPSSAARTCTAWPPSS